MAETFFSLLIVKESYDLDLKILEQQYRTLSQKWHPDRQGTFDLKNPKERMAILLKAAELNQAYKTLKDEQKRAAYLLHLHGVDVSAENEKTMSNPEFLMEILDLQEKLQEAQQDQNEAMKQSVFLEIGHRSKQAKERLSKDFIELEQGNRSILPQLTQTFFELRYYERFQEGMTQENS